MKKTLSYVALGLIFVLAIVIIAFTFVEKNFNINLENPYSISIRNNGTESESYFFDSDVSENKEIYNKLLNEYNNSYKQKIMSSLFQGILASNARIERVNSSMSTIDSGTYLHFVYNDAQTLKLNGKVYTYHFPSPSTSIDTNIPYSEAYVQVLDSNSMSQINVYVSKVGTSNLTYKYVVYANQGNLFDYITELTK